MKIIRLSDIARFLSIPTLHWSGDSGYTPVTPDVAQALAELKPDVAVVAAGSARMDVGSPILMPMAEILDFAARAPGRVVANHLEALNHCPTTRSLLRRELETRGLLEKTLIPADGEIIDLRF